MNDRKVAVVTGGASGIGRGISALLADDGFAVAVLDLDKVRAEETAADLTARGRRAVAYAADVTDLASIATVRDAIQSDLGVPSAVINNVGWSVIEPFIRTEPDFWRKTLEINLGATIGITRSFLDGMIEARSGSIVNIASDAGRVGSTGEVVYAAAKGGVIAFTKALAREMARYDICVKCVCPGPTATPMLLGQDQKRIDALTNAIPFRRLAEPGDIAGAVAYFVSDRSRYVTGQVISVSGGLTMAG